MNLKKMTSLNDLATLVEFFSTGSLLTNSVQDDGQKPGVKVQVWQNHSSITLCQFATTLLRLNNVEAQFTEMGYDDSLSWAGLDEGTDIFLAWVDLDRYEDSEQFREWLGDRLRTLISTRERRTVCYLSSKSAEFAAQLVSELKLKNVHSTFQIAGERQFFKGPKKFFDERLETFTGTYLSKFSQVSVSVHLAQQIKRSVTGAIKLIIVDMDWTLYAGVISEDGIDGVEIRDDHKAFAQILKLAKSCGAVLAIATKNQDDEAREFFKKRGAELGLIGSDFLSIEANYEPKTMSIQKLIAAVRTTAEQTLFVDDNVGELSDALQALPDLNVLVANTGTSTNVWLENFPGLVLNEFDDMSETRLESLKHLISLENEIGTQFQKTETAPLRANVEIRINLEEDIDRVASMSERTNQFNANLRRIDVTELRNLIDEGAQFVTASLKDAFSDSGVIFAAVFSKSGNTLVSQNLLMSCRALGRGLENAIAGAALLAAAKNMPEMKSISINWVRGPRNSPALKWLESFDKAVAKVEMISGIAHIPLSALEGIEKTNTNLNWSIRVGNQVKDPQNTK